MSITPDGRIYSISAQLPAADVALIKSEMRACIRGFCKSNTGQWFSVRDLFGGEYRDWRNTFMQRIYDYYKRQGYTDKEAHKRSAIDAGRLLKRVLHEDKYAYEWKKRYVNLYRRK